MIIFGLQVDISTFQSVAVVFRASPDEGGVIWTNS